MLNKSELGISLFKMLFWVAALFVLGVVWLNAPTPVFIAAVAAIFIASVLLRKFFGLFKRPYKYGGGRVEEHERALKGRGKPLSFLAKQLDLSEAEISSYKPVYKFAKIPKRSGGERRLCIPDKTTKELQRKVLRKVLRELKAHEAATGFERDKSILDNAKLHVARHVIVNMDVVDFFESTKSERINYYFRRIGWDKAAAEALTKITTYDGGLPQGAPTSPRLSNLVNRYLDAQLSNLAKKCDAIYSRYADDITFSFAADRPDKVRTVLGQAHSILRSKKYKMHSSKKLRILRRHQRQMVTGLVVNEKANLPRKTRRWLRAVEHRQKSGKKKPSLTAEQLAGWRSYARMISG